MGKFFEELNPCFCSNNAALYLSDTFVALEKNVAGKNRYDFC